MYFLVKTLDGTITRKSKEDDSLHALSMKCTDINLQMFHTLGVSKPILNYVIFCHQEDSNWPLEEGSKVKEKFDEIFSSAKYKDALKKIKEVRAGYVQKEKMDKKELEYLSSEMKEAKQKRKNLQDKENARKNMEAEIISMEKQLKPIFEDLRVINELQTNYDGIKEEVGRVKSDLDNCKREINDLRPKIITLLPDNVDDDGIERMKKEMELKHKDIKNRIDRLSEELETISEANRRFEKEGKRLMGSIGQCDGTRKSNDRNTEELFNSLHAIGRRLNWDDLSSDLSEEEIVLCRSKIKDTIETMEKDKKSAIEKYDQDTEKQNEEINKLGSEKAQLVEQKRLKGEERSKTQRMIAQIKRSLSELQGSEMKLNTITERLEDKETELEEAKREVDVDTLKDKIRDKANESEELSEKLDRIKAEKEQLESQREIATQISLKTKDLNEKSRKLDRTLAGKNSELTMVFNNEVPDTKKLRECFDQRREELQKLKNEFESKNGKLLHDIENKKNERKILSREVDVKEERIKRFERELQDSDLLDVDDNFEEELQKTKDEVDKTRLELEIKQANKYTYQELIDKINKMQLSSSTPCCPTCNRIFETPSEANDVKRELENDIKRIPSKVHSIQNKLNKLVKKVDKLQSLLPEKKQTDEMKKEVSDKRKLIVNLDKAIKKSDEQLSENQDNLDVALSDYSVCDDLRDYVAQIDQLYRETSDIKYQVQTLKNKCPELSNSRDYNIVKKEEETLFQRINALRKEADHCRSLEIEHEKRIATLERERNKYLEDKLEIQKNQREMAGNQEKKLEYEKTLKECDISLVEIDQSLLPIQELEDDAKRKKHHVLIDKERTVNEMDQNLNEIRKMKYDVEKKHQTSIEYKNSGNEEKLMSLKKEYDKISEKKKSQEILQKTAETDRTKLQEEDANQITEKRNLDDNTKLRGYKKREKECAAKIMKYKDEMNNLDYENNERRRRELKENFDNIDRQRTKLNGRLGELENTIEELEEELNADKYRTAESRHKRKSIEARCRYHVINDLNKYYIALDWSIMRFHQERMKVINRIIRELWRATYRGNDIDFIEIETEDGVDALAGADKRKNVNYRVVMVKNETKLDMRGRCSAGQKVLASLIIRLALAETFSNSCGMIALDEPTTNLDRENIESLAQALADLVAKRSSQRNFQLIVITHDEELIDHLSRIDQVDYFFRVSRDEKGRSIIRRNANNMY